MDYKVLAVLPAIFFAVSCAQETASDQPMERQFAPERQGFHNNLRDDDEFELFGDVDSLAIIHIQNKKDGTTSELVSQTFKFNENGDVVRTVRHDYYGNPEEITTYKYDSNGNMIQEERIKRGKKDVNIRYSYDAQNRLIDENGYGLGQKVKIHHTYDESGNEVEIKYVGEGFKSVMKYDSDNKLVDESAYSLDGKEHRSQYLYEYDSKGNLISETHKSIWRNYIWKIEAYTYDDSNRLVSHTRDTYKEDGSSEGKRIEIFNEYGDLIDVENYWGDMSRSIKYSYKYDCYGGLVEKKSYDENDKLEKHLIFEMTYDSQGNRLTYQQQTHYDEYSYSISDYRKYNIFYRQ